MKTLVVTNDYPPRPGGIQTYVHELLVRQPPDEVVVLAIPDEEITNRLKAVVVLKAGTELTTDDLKQHCAATLPRYMVPETIEFRAQLPRTSSGKVDRRALIDA